MATTKDMLILYFNLIDVSKQPPRPALPPTSDVPMKLPRSFKRPKWHLGIRSQSHPQNIMQVSVKCNV